MGQLIKFPELQTKSSGRSNNSVAPGLRRISGEAKILLFTGIRYERREVSLPSDRLPSSAGSSKKH